MHAVRIGRVRTEFLRGDRIDDARAFDDVADFAEVAKAIGAQPPVGRLPVDANSALHLTVIDAVACRAARADTAAKSRCDAESDGESFHAVEAHEVRDPTGGESECLWSLQRLGADEGPRFLLHLPHFGVGDGADVEGERVENATAEVERVAHRFRRDLDLIAAKERRRKTDVHLVVADLPTATDDAADGIVEPRAAAANLELLPRGQPEATAHEAVLDDDEQVFQRVVAKRRAREVERHAHDLRVFGIDVDGADDARFAIVFRAHLHFQHLDGASGKLQAERVRGDREVVRVQPLRGQRVRNVDDLVAIPEPDDRGEVVLDDAQMIAVVGDVGGKEQRVPPPHDMLLAEVGRAPVNFIHELISLHHLGRLGEPFADLRQKGDIAMRHGLVVLQARVGELLSASCGGALHERAGARIVPLLRTGDAWRECHQPENACGHGRGEAMHR